MSAEGIVAVAIASPWIVGNRKCIAEHLPAYSLRRGFPRATAVTRYCFNSILSTCPEFVGDLADIETIASGRGIRELPRLRRLYGKGRWRKMKARAQQDLRRPSYDPATADAFATGADGTLTVIHQDGPDAYRAVETVQTSTGSRNMGLDQTTHRLFVPSAKFTPAAAPTASAPRPRPTVVPGSFALLVIERAAVTR